MACIALCLFGLYVVYAMMPVGKRERPKSDERVYLVHSDELKFDQYGATPDAQIVKGNVHFRHGGAQLWCDSAYFYQESNSVRAFGHVRFKQGDTLSLNCDHATYDGQGQLMEARENVVLRHRQQTLYTDSLNYDRLYGFSYFLGGGKLVDGKNQLVADWGEYHMDSRDAMFYYNVKMRGEKRTITTDTLFYNTRESLAHVLGPSVVVSGESVIHTRDGYFNTDTEGGRMFGRSVLVNGSRTVTGDSLYYNSSTGQSEGFGNVVYEDTVNKNTLTCEELKYNEKSGFGYATKHAVATDYSQGDTLYLHADSMKIYTFNINTDSVYRKVHAFFHVKAYRKDVQTICDSMVFSSQDSCMTMYRDPIVWNGNRQLLGEVIKVYMNDSTVRNAHVIGQALSVEKVDDERHYNQVTSKVMDAFFLDGNIRKAVSIGNVRTIYYPIDDKDSTYQGLNYLETDTLRMYISPDRKLQKIRTTRFNATMYPMSQIPPDMYRLPNFVWLETLRPTDKNDIFVWRGKSESDKLKSDGHHGTSSASVKKEKVRLSQ